MTDPLFQKLNTAAQDIHLEPHERNAMREALFTHMRQRPLAVGYLTPTPYRFFTMHRVLALALVPLFLIVSAGGTAYAAQGALPGDVLYPVKIGVNEQVETALATTPTQKAMLNVELAQRRLEEAQSLAMQGKLDATTTAQLQSNLNVHAQQAQELAQTVAKVDPSQATEISTQLVSSLAANDAILEDLADHSKDESVRQYTKELSSAVRAHLETGINVTLAYAGAATSSEPAATSAKMTLVTFSSGTASSSEASSTRAKPQGPSATVALKLGQRATAELSSATDAFKSERSTLDATTSANVTAELSSDEQLLEDGNAALKAGDTARALSDFTQAYSAAIRIETILSAAHRLGPSLITSLFSILGQGDEAQSATSTASTTDAHASSTSDQSAPGENSASISATTTLKSSEQSGTQEKSNDHASHEGHSHQGWFPFKLDF